IAGWRIPVRGRFAGTVRGVVEPYVGLKGNLTFEQPADAGAAVRVARAHAFTQRALHSARRRRDAALVRPGLLRRYYRLCQRLPVVPGLTVFESHMGRQFSDNPKYVYQAAVRAGSDALQLRPVWSYATL